MKRIICISLFVIFALTSLTSAAETPSSNLQTPEKLSIIIFLNKLILNDTQALDFINKGVRAKFPHANIVIYEDSTPKSPEYREFIEKIQTDPINEKGNRYITREHLISYGKSTNADYVMKLSIRSRESEVNIWSLKTLSHMKQDVTIVDVNTGKYILNKVWDTEKKVYFRTAAKDLIGKLQSDFIWPEAKTTQDELISQSGEPKVSIVVFLPQTINHEPQLVETMRNALKNKFKPASIDIFDDNLSKDLAYLDFIEKVTYDSAKQRSLVIKKEHLMQYGKDANSSHVVVVSHAITDWKQGFVNNFRSKVDIYAISVASGKYVFNSVIDTEKYMNSSSSIEHITKKIDSEIKLPEELQGSILSGSGK